MPKIIGVVVAFLVLALLGRFLYMSSTSEAPETLGTNESALAACPDSPNCVSSTAARESQRVEPLQVAGTPEEALARVRAVLEDVSGARLVDSDVGYLRYEFTSRLFRFVDDLELLHDPAIPGFHVRSASRVGHSDLGANRRRVENLRSKL